MARSYEIKPTEHGWRMAVTEDGVEIAGAAAGHSDEDYAFLLEQAEAICSFD